MPNPPGLSGKISKDAKDKLDGFAGALRSKGMSLPDNPLLAATMQRIFAFSDFVAESLTQNPEILIELTQRNDLGRRYAADEYEKKVGSELAAISRTENRDVLSSALRRLRCREMIRIAWRDLASLADIEETMGDLSALADACIDQALLVLYDWQCMQFGTPYGSDGSRQYLVVIGMGKLGGRELNFSSDVDLLFVYPKRGETKGGPKDISNEEFFTRLCQHLIHVIGTTTSNGFVFRVDTRLRPFGEGGPIVMSFDAMEEYYQRQGREWERYALIKARIVGGDKEAGTSLLTRLKPFVYRKYLDFGVFDSLRGMKEKISLEIKRKGMRDNIKLGPGGIREIEFFGQIFQLTRGGISPILQEQGIQKVLSILAQERHIESSVCDELLSAYEFLRKTENRIQEFLDHQTHELPSDPLGKERLSLSMGFSEWALFKNQLKHHMERVHHYFNKLLGSNDSTVLEDQEEKVIHELGSIWQTFDKYEGYQNILHSVGFADPEKVVGVLKNLRNDPATRSLSSDGRTRLNRLIPLILSEAGTSEHPDLVFNRIIDLIKTIERRTNYLSLLLENPAARLRLVQLASASPWIASFLSLHPVLLDELLYPGTLYLPPERPALEREIRKKLSQISPEDLESQLIQLSVFKQVNTLRVAAADVTGALPLMRVSDCLTEIIK